MIFTSLLSDRTTYQKRRRLLIVAFIIAELLLLVTTSQGKPAFASAPYYTYSYYMTNQSNITYAAYQLGCGQGTTDRNSGQNRDDIMIIDFGAQYNNGGNWGAVYPAQNVYTISEANIHAAAVQVAAGYYQCLANANSSTLVIAVGTNNSGSQTNSTAGARWAQMVNSIEQDIINQGFSGHANANGATDTELDWSTSTSAKNWINGYIGSANRRYYNFGDAAGCPPYGSCNHGWTQDDIWYVSWGASGPYSFVIPEIYYNGNQTEWQQISLYGAINKNSRILFSGALTQQGSCGGCGYSPSAGWQALYDAVNSDSRTAQSIIAWSTDIRYE